MRRTASFLLLAFLIVVSSALIGCTREMDTQAEDAQIQEASLEISEESDAMSSENTYRNEALASENTYKYEIQELEYVDSENLFLMGTSQGGAVSAITGAAHKEEIRGMVLLYPAFLLAERANELFQSVEEIPDTYFFLWMEVGRVYFEPLIGYDIYEEIAAYDRDVLMIHGDADSIVPLTYSERALEVYPSSELKVISGGGHGFYGEDARQVIDYMLEYLEAHRV